LPWPVHPKLCKAKGFTGRWKPPSLTGNLLIQIRNEITLNNLMNMFIKYLSDIKKYIYMIGMNTGLLETISNMFL